MCQRNKRGPNSELHRSDVFRQKNKLVLRQSDTKSECFKTIKKLKPYQQSGKPQGNEKWPLNRGWLLNRGKGNGRFHIWSLIRCVLDKGGRLIGVSVYIFKMQRIVMP